MKTPDIDISRAITRDLADHAATKAFNALIDAVTLCRTSEERMGVIAAFMASVTGQAAGAVAAELGVKPESIDPLQLVPAIMDMARAANLQRGRS